VLDKEGAGLVAAGRARGVTLRRGGVRPGTSRWHGAVRPGASRWHVVAQLDVQPEAFGALGQQVAVGETHELAGELAGRDRKAELRPDAGRLAGGEGYAGKGRTQSLYST
jgi:hypothetical protein